MSESNALESLVQRGRTLLFNDIADLVQRTMDALQDNPQLTGGDVISLLHNMNFPEKLKHIVLMETGFPISTFFFMESLEPNACATFVTKPLSIKRIQNEGATVSSIMEKVNDTYNHQKAILSEMDFKKDFGLVLGLGITTAYWTTKVNGDYYFTADEIAATILHEVGHFDHYIRMGGRLYRHEIDAAEIVDYVKNQPDPEVVRAILSKIKHDKAISRNWINVINVLEKDIESTGTVSGKLNQNYLNILAYLITYNKNSKNAFYVFKKEADGVNDSSSLVSNKRKTDVGGVDAERSADEFSARNGAYAALVSVHEKSHAMDDRRSHLYYRQFMWEIPSLLAAFATNTISALNPLLETKYDGYDPLVRRMELIVETAKHSFSDKDLPDQIKQYMKDQIKQSEEIIKSYKAAKSVKFRQELFKWITQVSKLGRVLQFPSSRLNSDYSRLQDATRSISRHPLYYLART